jgi:hypothetical protein
MGFSSGLLWGTLAGYPPVFPKGKVLSCKKTAFHSGMGIAYPIHNFSRYEEKNFGPRPCSVPDALCCQIPQWSPRCPFYNRDTCGVLVLGLFWAGVLYVAAPSGRPSHNCSFAKFRKTISFHSIIFRNFAKPQRVIGHAMTTLLTLDNSAKMNKTAISGKAVFT